MAGGRRVGGLVVACLLASTLVACDGGSGTAEDPGPSTSGSPSGPASAPSATGTGGPERLTFGVYGDDDVVDAYRRIAETFTHQEPQVEVEVTRYRDAASVAGAVTAAAGTSTGPDVFLLDQLQLPRLVEADVLAPLDEALDERGLAFGDDFQRSALTTFSADAQLQCMPVEMSPLVVYWNRDLVPVQALRARELEFPRGADTWTWETFEAAARAVAERDLLGPVKGTWLPPRLDLVTAFLRSGGENIVDDDLDPETLTLSSEDTVETLSSVIRLASDPVVSLTPADLERRDAAAWFAAGDLGFLIGTRAELPRLQAAADRRGLDFGVVSLPSFGRATTVSRATGLCVNAGSDAVESATDLVAWAVGTPAARIAAASGRLVPSRLDALTSVAFTQPGQPPRRSEAYAAGAKRSRPLPYSPRWPAVEAQAQQELQRLFSPRSADLGTRALTRRLTRLEEESRLVLQDESAD